MLKEINKKIKRGRRERWKEEGLSDGRKKD